VGSSGRAAGSERSDTQRGGSGSFRLPLHLRAPQRGHLAQCTVIDSVYPQLGQAVFWTDVRVIGLFQLATAFSAISRSSAFEEGG